MNFIKRMLPPIAEWRIEPVREDHAHNKTAEIAWQKLPTELKQKAVRRLREQLHPLFLDEVYSLCDKRGLGNWLPLGFHFGVGMSIRNTLRRVIWDHELPGLPEVYGVDYGGNWDDYYIQCLEAAVGQREFEEEPTPLADLGDEIWDTCEEKGFHDPIDPEVGEQAVRLLLTISEICEAFEAIRKGKPKGEYYAEIADTFIRLLHYASHEGIDIDHEVRRKMEINKNRPYKHGVKF